MSIHCNWVAVVLITVCALNAVFYSRVQIDICFYILWILPDSNHFLYDFSMQWSLSHVMFIEINESCTSLMWVNRYLLIFSTFLDQFLSHLLTLWCRVLLEKLTGLQLVKKFSAFHGTWRFITALTSVRQLSLSWAGPIQSIYPHPTSWRYILILFQVPIFIPLCMRSNVSPRNHPPGDQIGRLVYLWIVSSPE